MVAAWSEHERQNLSTLSAVAHSILVIGSTMLKTNSHYQDLGADYFFRLNHDELKRYYIRQLERMGPQSMLSDRPAIA